MTVYEQICASVSVGEVCVANTPLIKSFTCTCRHSFKHSGDLTRHQHRCGTQHSDHVNLDPPTFTALVAELFIGGEISQELKFTFLQGNIRNPDHLFSHFIQGFTQGYCKLDLWELCLWAQYIEIKPFCTVHT